MLRPWATLLVLLVLSPCTAPFQTCDLSTDPFRGSAPAHDALTAPVSDADDTCLVPGSSPTATQLRPVPVSGALASAFALSDSFAVSADGRLQPPNRHRLPLSTVLRV